MVLCGSIFTAFFFAGGLSASAQTPPTITTFAGTGADGSSGDGGPALDATFKGPRGVTLDRAGNIYVADMFGHVVRKIGTDGTITTVAGTGEPGFSGDGGPATSAQLNGPTYLAVDGEDNLYISDTENHRVRKVSGGIITTVAGKGTPGYSGDEDLATGAELNVPGGMTFDAIGNLYIADSSNYRIRVVSPQGIITSLKMNRGIEYVADVAIDPTGTIFAAERGNDVTQKRVVKILSDGSVVAYAGFKPTPCKWNCPEVEQEFTYVMSLSFDGEGALIVSDTARVYRIKNGVSIVVAGTGAMGSYQGDGNPADEVNLSPWDSAIDAEGNLLLPDINEHRVFKVANAVAPTLSGGVTVPPCQSTVKGDTNGDLAVDILDAVSVLRSVVGMESLPDECARAAADVNCDGNIKVGDAVLILQHIVMGEALPSCQ